MWNKMWKSTFIIHSTYRAVMQTLKYRKFAYTALNREQKCINKFKSYVYFAISWSNLENKMASLFENIFITLNKGA